MRVVFIQRLQHTTFSRRGRFLCFERDMPIPPQNGMEVMLEDNAVGHEIGAVTITTEGVIVAWLGTLDVDLVIDQDGASTEQVSEFMQRMRDCGWYEIDSCEWHQFIRLPNTTASI